MQSHTHSNAIFFLLPLTAIAELAERNQNLLVPDEGAQYDQLIEIDLSKVSLSHGVSVCVSVCLFVCLSVCLFVCNPASFSSPWQLEPLVNGPFTPDLANPISQLGKNAKEKGWPTEIKVGKSWSEEKKMRVEVLDC